MLLFARVYDNYVPVGNSDSICGSGGGREARRRDAGLDAQPLGAGKLGGEAALALGPRIPRAPGAPSPRTEAGAPFPRRARPRTGAARPGHSQP